MFNKLCLYERGHFTEPEMCSPWQNISISYNSCRYSFVIASVGFNSDRVTTQHTLNKQYKNFVNLMPFKIS